MQRLTWASLVAPKQPLGLQNYERHVTAALCAIEQRSWEFKRLVFGGLRTRGSGLRKVPMRLLDGPDFAAHGLGRLAYLGTTHVHRFDLRLPPPGQPEVVTIHDLAPLRFEDEGEIPPWALRSAREARLIICPSDFAAQEIRDILGLDNVFVVPNGVSDDFRTAVPFTRAERERRGLPHHFALTAGGRTQRKNLKVLADAWNQIADDVAPIGLVATGPASDEMKRLLADTDRLVCAGYQPQGELVRLVASATAVVVPSLYEGFGLPALEAMAAGVPVVAANATALPEVCGEAARPVDPMPRDLLMRCAPSYWTRQSSASGSNWADSVRLASRGSSQREHT